MLANTLPDLSAPLMQPTAQIASPLKAPEKAAVIIGLLGAEYAAPIVEKIEDHHLRRFMKALGGLHDIPRETMLGAVAEFITELNQKKGGFKGGPKTVETFMENLFDADRVAQLFGKAPAVSMFDADRVAQLFGKPTAVSTGGGADKVWADMKTKPATDLTAFLSEQRPEVVSLILAELTPIESGEILSELPEELSVACVRQLARGIASRKTARRSQSGGCTITRYG